MQLLGFYLAELSTGTCFANRFRAGNGNSRRIERSIITTNFLILFTFFMHPTEIAAKKWRVDNFKNLAIKTALTSLPSADPRQIQYQKIPVLSGCPSTTSKHNRLVL